MQDSRKILIGAFLLVYVGVCCLDFTFDFLNSSPVLDARENVYWVSRISEGALPDEPFYRALLYPYVLSWLPLSWAIPFGYVCHLVNAVCVYYVAGKIWGARSAGCFGGGLYLIYPVSLYFAGLLLDITFGLSLFLLALVSLFAANHRKDTDSRRKTASMLYLAGGLLGGLAVLARPNFLPAAVLLPLVPFFKGGWGRGLRTKMVSGVLVLAALGMPLLAQGFLNDQLSGRFRVLPWQGAYNLYAANREGANGKFYQQRLSFDAVPAGMNTTRMESELLYAQATGTELSALDIDAMNRYWRGQLFDYVRDQPSGWLHLMMRKAVYLFNDWEQYNNLTYAYHKDRLFSIRYNPLGWGVLLLLSMSALLLVTRRASAGALAFIGVLIGGYAVGLLLFFVSARFRLPLVPLMAVLAGGCVLIDFKALVSAGRMRLLGLVGVLCLVSGLTYGNWFSARDDASFIQDDLLLATAASKLGEDDEALKFATQALNRDPSRQEARSIQVVSLFNRWLATRSGELGGVYWARLGDALRSTVVDDASECFIAGVYDWRSGRAEPARVWWKRALSEELGDAAYCQAALLVTSEGVRETNEGAIHESVRQILY